MDRDIKPTSSTEQSLRQRIVNLEREIVHLQTSREEHPSHEEISHLRRIELMLANSRDIILFIRSSDGRILEANHAALQGYGYTREEMLRLTIFDLRAPETKDTALAQFQEAEARGILFETVHRRKDGATFPVEVSAQGVDLGLEHGLISIIRNITERVQSQTERERLLGEIQQEKAEALQRAEELNAVLEAMNDPVMVYNPAGVVSRANASAKKVHGFDPSMRHRDESNRRLIIHHPDGSDVVTPELPSERALNGHAVINERFLVTNAQGVEMTLLITATPLIVNGAHTGAVSVWQDITEQSRSELALQQALAKAEEGQRLLDALLENIPEGITVADAPDVTIRMVSRYGEELLEGPHVEMTAKQVAETWKVYYPDGVTPMPEDELPLVRAVRRGEVVKNQDLVQINTSGRALYLTCTASPIRDAAGAVVGGVVAWRDISERKQTEAALRESENRLKIIIENLPHGLIVVDPKGSRLQWNRVALEMHGYTQPDPELESFENLVDIFQLKSLDQKELTFEQRPIPRLIRGDEFHDETLIIRDRRMGWEQIFSYQGKLIYDEHGQELMGVLSIRDVTSQIHAEQALAASTRQLERSNRELEQFAFAASHDLQEPLRKIEAFSEALLQTVDSNLSPNQQDYLDRMRKAAKRMRAMINGLLQLSRVTTQAQPFVEVDLVKTAGEVLADLDHQIQRTGGVVHVTELPKVVGDPVQIAQLLQNLIGNALKFHPPGVTPEVNVSAEQDGDIARITIQDNGIGFDPSDAERMFQPFQRLVGISQYEGSGMGLAICSRIVQRHGGDIQASSQPGKGSTFIITLPRTANAQSHHHG